MSRGKDYEAAEDFHECERIVPARPAVAQDEFGLPILWRDARRSRLSSLLRSCISDIPQFGGWTRDLSRRHLLCRMCI